MSETSPDGLSPEERRLLNRALGCAVEEFVARFGAENAIRRIQTELRRARRARSRKLYSFWSAILARIDTEMDPPQSETPRQKANGWKASTDKREAGARTFRSPRGASAPKRRIGVAAVLSTRNRGPLRHKARQSSPVSPNRRMSIAS